MPSLRLFLSLLILSTVSACSRAPDLVGINNARAPVAAEDGTTQRTVFIATTREATDVAGAFYSGERAPELGFASVVVSIPPTHVTGALERPAKLPPDPATEFAVIDPVVYGSDNSFVRYLNRELAKLPAKDREILLFVHGYNNTTSDAILRLAQFVEDTDFNGVPVLFTWASAGRASHYVYDLNSVLVARPKLLEASRVLGRTNATGFDIFAHSMGSLLTMEAIVEASLAGRHNPGGRLKNIMFAAPDIDIDLFRSQISRLRPDQRNFYIFVSEDDAALRLSRRLSGGVERVGSADAAELSELGVTVIDLSEVDDSTSGSHSKFAGSPEVVQLIGGSLETANFDEDARPPTLVEVLDGVPVVRLLVE